MVWVFLIPLIAAGLHGMSMVAEFLLHDREKAKEIKLDIARKQRKIKELKNEGNTNEMMKVQKDLFGLMGKQMRLSFKPMLMSFPLFIIVFWLLNGMLIYDPIYVGQQGQIGLSVRNTGSVPHEVQAKLLAGSDLTVVDAVNRTIQLSKEGNEGDADTIWWTIQPSSEGDKEYQVALNVNNDEEVTKELQVKVVPEGALTYQFTPDLNLGSAGDVVVGARYRNLIVANVAGFDLTWFWYYLVSYFLLSAVFSPLKNKFLWGHWRGLKHIEKVELEKEQNEANTGQEQV